MTHTWVGPFRQVLQSDASWAKAILMFFFSPAIINTRSFPLHSFLWSLPNAQYEAQSFSGGVSASPSATLVLVPKTFIPLLSSHEIQVFEALDLTSSSDSPEIHWRVNKMNAPQTEDQKVGGDSHPATATSIKTLKS